MDARPPVDNGPDGPIDRMRERWNEASPIQKRWVLVAAVALVLAGLTFLIADLTWRKDVPRPWLVAAWLLLSVVTAYLLVGRAGPTRVMTLVAAAGVALTFVGGERNLDAVFPDGPAPSREPVCPGFASDAPLDGFVGNTDLGYTQVREGPALGAPLVAAPNLLAVGCRVAFSGYCFGEPKDDWRFDTPNPVWFRLAGKEGYVAAADLRAESPIAGYEPDACPTGLPPPQGPELTAPLKRSLSGAIEIAAAAPDSAVVGFAAYYEDRPGTEATARWHQIGADTETADGITVRWDTRSVPGQSSRRTAPVTLAVVNCQGLGNPYGEVVTRSYLVSNRGTDRTSSPKLSAPRAEAGEVACNNADR